MKRYTSIAAILAALAMTSAVHAGIVGSKHDFGGKAWSNKEICLPCHTPHNAQVFASDGTTELGGPLWNHTLSNATYTMYMPQADGTTKRAAGNVDTNSMLCLSCHDGTVALDSFGGGAGTAGPIGSASNGTDPLANLGTDLSNDHPIGDAAIWPTPNPSYMVDPSLRVGIMPLRPMATGKLAVGCTSCHEPHNRTNKGGANDPKHMLWVANDIAGTTVDGRAVSGSLLCLNCHKK
jgi:hypothetical protein